MVGSPGKTSRKPRSRASFSSSEPGSVIATKNSPRPPFRSQKKSRCERVSSVVPDFEEAMKSVLSRSRRSSECRISAGCVVSSTWRERSPKLFLSTSGARLEPPIPSRTNVSITPGAARSSTNRCRSSIRSRIRCGSSSQPSHFSSPEPVQTVGSRSQIRSTSCSVAIAMALLGRGELAALRADAVEELREGVGELLDAFLLEDADDVVVVDARFRELLEEPSGLVDPPLQGQRDLAVVLEGLDRLFRHRVHGLGADELLDVHHVSIGRVLRGGRGPEAPLRRRAGAGAGELFPAAAREDPLVPLVGELRDGDREL